MAGWRRASVYGTGKRGLLDREQRAVFKARLGLARRPGRLSSTAVRLGELLLRLLGPDGRLDPSRAFLAKALSVDISTIDDCLRRLAAEKLLSWERRLVRCRATNWRVEQTSSAYVLLACTDRDFSPRVTLEVLPKTKSVVRSVDNSWENAARQLLALGAAVPKHIALNCK